MIRNPPCLRIAAILRVPTAPILTFRRNSRSLLNPTIAAFNGWQHLGHQVRHRNAQGDGQPLDIQQRDVAFAALDTANVGPMKAGKVAQRFLRNPLLLADFAESFPKSNLYVGQDRTLCCVNRLGCLQLLTAVSGIAYYRSTAFTLR